MPAPGNHGGFNLDQGLGTLGDGARDAFESKNSPKANMISVIDAEENFLWVSFEAVEPFC